MYRSTYLRYFLEIDLDILDSKVTLGYFNNSKARFTLSQIFSILTMKELSNLEVLCDFYKCCII